VEGSSYRRIFRDVVRGYSSTVFLDKAVYIKHLSPHDQVELEEIEEKYFNIALKRGVPTEEDMLQFLGEEEQWTGDDEKEIENSTILIKSLEKGRTKMLLKKQVDSQTKLIEREKNKLAVKQLEKIDLLGNTCEKYAKDRLHDFYMIKSFFKDGELKESLYSEEEFDFIESEDLKRLIHSYNKIFDQFSEEGIQYTILDDFFAPYLGFAEDSMQFFGIPFCHLTYNQVRLIVYARVFKNIFDYNENIPEQIKKDPQKLLDYGSISKEEREKMKERISGGDGSTLVGATDEDYEYLGIEKPTGSISLHEEAKKKGGTLEMKDLMKLHGVKGA
jgi:hypothetical protein